MIEMIQAQVVPYLQTIVYIYSKVTVSYYSNYMATLYLKENYTLGRVLWIILFYSFFLLQLFFKDKVFLQQELDICTAHHVILINCCSKAAFSFSIYRAMMEKNVQLLFVFQLSCLALKILTLQHRTVLFGSVFLAGERTTVVFSVIFQHFSFSPFGKKHRIHN